MSVQMFVPTQINVDGAMVNVSDLHNPARVMDFLRRNPNRTAKWCPLDATCTCTGCSYAHHKTPTDAAASVAIAMPVRAASVAATARSVPFAYRKQPTGTAAGAGVRSGVQSSVPAANHTDEMIKVEGAMVKVSDLRNSDITIEYARTHPEAVAQWCKFGDRCTKEGTCSFAHRKQPMGATAGVVPPTSVNDASIYIDLDQFADSRRTVDQITTLLMGIMARLVKEGLARDTARISIFSFSVPTTLSKPNLLTELNKLQVVTRVVSDRKKEETDRQLEREAMCDPNRTIVLVSSDQDFICCIRALRQREKHVVVVHGAPQGTPWATKLGLYPNATWFYSDFSGIPSDRVNVGGAMVKVSDLHHSDRAIQFARDHPEEGAKWCKQDGNCSRMRDGTCLFAHNKKTSAAVVVTQNILRRKHQKERDRTEGELRLLKDPLLRLQSQLTHLFELGKAHVHATAAAHNFTIVENCCLAETDGVVARFLQATPTGLPNLTSGRLDPFVWVFHGCPSPQGVRDIMRSGFDPTKRYGQVYGPGEYFAPTIDVPLMYSQKSGAVLLVLVRPDEVKKEKDKQYYVVENPTTADGGTFCLPVLALCKTVALPPCATIHRPQQTALAVSGAAANPNDEIKVEGAMVKIADLHNSDKAIQSARDNPGKEARWCKYDGTCTFTGCKFTHRKVSAAAAVTAAVSGSPDPAVPPVTSVEFKDDLGAWIPYGDAAAVQSLLSAQRVGKTAVTITLGQWVYNIDLAQMTQTNSSTGKVRDIRFK